ncbi:hypothetical protein PF008_g149 [Phytophthora fragariae]|uniref:Uncharacterized protein n=1 Tax=Phytophthora fragariae TaxID=53985 RepID=A0A6G0SPM2_9STRA|nr:hypothetical protein PF008_g149 [Phytophthora fragariae]
MFLFHLDAESAKLGFVLGYAEDVVGCKVYFPEERMAKFVSDLRVAKDVVYRDRHSVSIEDADLESLPFKRSENGIEAECSMDSDDIGETITELNLFETTVEAPNVNEFESLQSAELEGGEATGGRMEAKETALSAGLTGVEGVTAAIPSEVGTVVVESMNTAAADLESETHVTNVRQTEAPPYGVQPSLDTTQEQPSFGGENGQKDEMSSVKDNDSMAGKMWISCRVVDVRSRRC